MSYSLGWFKLIPPVPEDNQPVFINLKDGRLFLARTVYTGKNDTGIDEISFYVYDLNQYLHEDMVIFWHDIKIPQPPITR